MTNASDYSEGTSKAGDDNGDGLSLRASAKAP
jgi:hypothetical protein